CGLRVINGGIGGSRTSYMLPLVVEFTRMQYHPKAIVIATGMNDTHKTLWSNDGYDATFKSTYQAIVQAALNVSPNVFVTSISPVDYSGPIGSAISPHGRDKANEDIIAVAREFGLPIINADAIRSVNYPVSDALLLDGVHFTMEGK